jgi:hypothetical protein
MGLTNSKESNDDWNAEFARAEQLNRQFPQGQPLTDGNVQNLAASNINSKKMTHKVTVDAYFTEGDVKVNALTPRIFEVAIKVTLKIPSVKAKVNFWATEKFNDQDQIEGIESPVPPLTFNLTQDNPQMVFQLDFNHVINNRQHLKYDTSHFLVELFEPSVVTIYCFKLEANKSAAAKLTKKAAVINGHYSLLTAVYGLKSSSVFKGSEAELCLICFTEPIDVIINPCMHMCLCRGCALELSRNTRQCPLCRERFDGFTELVAK